MVVSEMPDGLTVTGYPLISAKELQHVGSREGSNAWQADQLLQQFVIIQRCIFQAVQVNISSHNLKEQRAMPALFCDATCYAVFIIKIACCEL